METRPIFVLLALLFVGGAFAQAYTWTDEHGVVHFSDRPHPDAEKIKLDTSSEPRGQPTTSEPTTRRSKSSTEVQPAYTKLEIVNPGPEETLWNIETMLNVDLDIEPSLRPSHQIRVTLDGMPQAVSGTSFQLKDVYRGEHNIRVEIIDSTGQHQMGSIPRRFFVRQTSVN